MRLSRLQTASESMRLHQETLASEVRRLHIAYGAETRPSTHELYVHAQRVAMRTCACVRACGGLERSGVVCDGRLLASERAFGPLCWRSEFADHTSA